MTRSGALFILTALLAVGCFGTPTPLAPEVGGSVGAPQQGVLTEAVELPAAGPGFRRLRPHDRAAFGTPSLVGALMRAAARVDAEHPGGEPLLIGDLSSERGGPLLGHRSHRSGRDADLLFYVTTPEGAIVRSPGFVPFGADGLARVHPHQEFVRLDVPRNWALVRALLEDPEAEVVWLFVSREVEALLVEHARALGEPDLLVWKAATVLLQPSDSAPHDDHFHLRVACTWEEARRGCLGGGPRWEWLAIWPALALTEDELAAAAALDADDELTRPLAEGTEGDPGPG